MRFNLLTLWVVPFIVAGIVVGIAVSPNDAGFDGLEKRCSGKGGYCTYPSECCSPWSCQADWPNPERDHGVVIALLPRKTSVWCAGWMDGCNGLSMALLLCKKICTKKTGRHIDVHGRGCCLYISPTTAPKMLSFMIIERNVHEARRNNSVALLPKC